MVGIGVLLLLVVLVAVLVVAGRVAAGRARERRQGSRPNEARSEPTDPTRPDLDERLTDWVHAELLTTAQADRIRGYERLRAAQPAPLPTTAPIAAPHRARSRQPLAEALGYVGGVLALAGAVLLVSRYWSDLATAARLFLSGSTAVLLLVAGALVPARHAPTARLRGVLWLAATGATAVFVVVAVGQGAGVSANETVALAAAGAIAVESGALWWGRARPVQQFAFLLALPATVGAALAHTGTSLVPAGVGVWLVGAVVTVAGLRRFVRSPIMSGVCGMVTVVGGGVLVATGARAAGYLLLVATAAALLALAVVPRLTRDGRDRIAAAVVGGVLALQVVPAAIQYFGQDAGAITGCVTGLAGVGLIVAADRRSHTAVAQVVQLAGAVLLLAGTAVTFGQWHGLAPVLGVIASIALIGFGMVRATLAMSIVGSAGLLINVLWLLARYFPGQGRAPVLVLVAGALIVGAAVLLSRSGRGPRRRVPRSHHG